jgi:hypothetical protein
MNAAGATSIVSFGLLLILVIALLATRKWIDVDTHEVHRNKLRELVLSKLRTARLLFEQSEISNDSVENMSNLIQAQVLLHDVTVLSAADDDLLSSLCNYDLKSMRSELHLKIEETKRHMQDTLANHSPD